MKQNTKLLEPKVRPDSPKGTGHFNFEFPTPISDPNANSTLQNDIVFCGKVMIRQTEPGLITERTKKPFLVRSESFRKSNPVQSNNGFFVGRDQCSGLLQLPATGDSRLLRRSSSSRRHLNSLFGVVKFPVQMELSDMKKRQERREPTSLPETPAARDGELVVAGARKSFWQLIRPSRRRGHLLSSNALATASLGYVPLI